ncbi:MAG: LysR family transcriptional regulator [Burkholderiaceae bacterium]|jgi:DNA-binding transcriptional LysR family regulator|nr:LysR family transcriptional regulator [Burkholderiaceae bacterium]
MRYDLTDLKLFMAIAQAGNLSRASQARYLTPSAASQRLRNLEHALGCQLFTREHKGMRLTDEGHAMLEHARGIFSAIDAMEAEAALLGSSLQGKATLAANSSSLHGFIGPHIGRFLTGFPEVNLTLVEQASETIAASVAEGEADLGIYAGEPIAGALACETFALDRLVVIAPPGHALTVLAGETPRAGPPSCRFHDTLAHAFVGMALTSSNYAFLREVAKRHGRPLRCRIHVDDFTSIVRLVAQGVGLAIVPHSIYRRLSGAHAVSCLALEETWARRPLQLVRSSERPLTPTAQQLRSFLQGLAQEDR